MPSVRGGVESAENVQLVLKHGEAAWKNGCPSSRPRSGHWTDRIRHRIIAEDATGRDRGGDDERAARTIDVRRPGVGEHAASHVVHQVVGIGGCLGSPSIGGRIIFKRVSEFAASRVGAASAHGVKLSVGREINANLTDANARHGRSCSPGAHRRCRCGRRACAADEIELSDPSVPAGASCGQVFVHMPKVGAIGRIDSGHAIVAPAAAGLAGGAVEHCTFPLAEVIWRIGYKTSGITNARERRSTRG